MAIGIENNLTVVCASHNGVNRIPLLIESIQNNVKKPKEIIICGTHESDISLVSKDILKKNNVSFIVSKFKNQIYQRDLALSKVKTHYILQLDDDLILDSNAIEYYCQHFMGSNSDKKVVCGYTVFPNGEHMSQRVKDLYGGSKLVRLFYSIINGFENIENMSILKSGRIFPMALDNQKVDSPEWLSSCLMFHKDALNKQSINNFQNNNFKGKAYYEDVLFTLLLKKKGFKLILDNNIILTHPYTTRIKPLDYIKTISRQKKLLQITGGSYFLFYFDVFVSTLFYFIQHVKAKLIKR